MPKRRHPYHNTCQCFRCINERDKRNRQSLCHVKLNTRDIPTCSRCGREFSLAQCRPIDEQGNSFWYGAHKQPKMNAHNHPMFRVKRLVVRANRLSALTVWERITEIQQFDAKFGISRSPRAILAHWAKQIRADQRRQVTHAIG